MREKLEEECSHVTGDLLLNQLPTRTFKEKYQKVIQNCDVYDTF
jgi:hypothetical protein